MFLFTVVLYFLLCGRWKVPPSWQRRLLPPFSFSPATTFRAMLLFDIGIGVTHSFFFGVKSHHITIDFVLYHSFWYFLSVIISFALNIKWNFTFGFFVCIVQRLKIRVGQRFVDRASFTWVKDQHSFQETHGLFIAPPKQFGKRSSLSFGKLEKTGPFFQKKKQKKNNKKSQPRHHPKRTPPPPPPLPPAHTCMMARLAIEFVIKARDSSDGVPNTLMISSN
jgi:hypothetical protein